MNSACLPLVVAAALAVAPQAVADPNKGPNTVAVHVAYADLDLGTSAGARAMLKRLARAANIACGGQPSPGVAQLSQQTRWEVCHAAALEASVRRVGSPKVAQLYAAQHAGAELAGR